MNLRRWRHCLLFNLAQETWVDPDTGGSKDQEGIKKIRDQLHMLDLWKSGPVIPGSLQGTEVLGDTWTLYWWPYLCPWAMVARGSSVHRGRTGIPMVVELCLSQPLRMQRRVCKGILKQNPHSPYPQCLGEPWTELWRERQGAVELPCVCERKQSSVVRAPVLASDCWARSLAFTIGSGVTLDKLFPVVFLTCNSSHS